MRRIMGRWDNYARLYMRQSRACETCGGPETWGYCVGCAGRVGAYLYAEPSRSEVAMWSGEPTPKLTESNVHGVVHGARRVDGLCEVNVSGIWTLGCPLEWEEA